VQRLGGGLPRQPDRRADHQRQQQLRDRLDRALPRAPSDHRTAETLQRFRKAKEMTMKFLYSVEVLVCVLLTGTAQLVAAQVQGVTKDQILVGSILDLSIG
jgi:hypothetical protein